MKPIAAIDEGTVTPEDPASELVATVHAPIEGTVTPEDTAN
jgi:hypothetical protein